MMEILNEEWAAIPDLATAWCKRHLIPITPDLCRHMCQKLVSKGMAEMQHDRYRKKKKVTICNLPFRCNNISRYSPHWRKGSMSVNMGPGTQPGI